MKKLMILLTLLSMSAFASEALKKDDTTQAASTTVTKDSTVAKEAPATQENAVPKHVKKHGKTKKAADLSKDKRMEAKKACIEEDATLKTNKKGLKECIKLKLSDKK